MTVILPNDKRVHSTASHRNAILEGAQILLNHSDGHVTCILEVSRFLFSVPGGTFVNIVNCEPKYWTRLQNVCSNLI